MLPCIVSKVSTGHYRKENVRTILYGSVIPILALPLGIMMMSKNEITVRFFLIKMINEDFGYKERDFYDFLSNKSRNELEQIMQLIGFDI